MATINTKADLYDLANEKARVWKSITVNNGDILVVGLKDVWHVSIQDPTKWLTPGWSVSTVNSVARVTFNLTGAYTGRVYVVGR